MNRRELVDAVATETGLAPAQADAALGAVLSAVTAALGAGDKVVLPGFGTFEVRDRAERAGRNPQTGEAITIAASRTAAFKPAPALRAAL